MNAGQHRFGKLHVKFRARAVECALENFLQFHTRLGVVVFARQVDQAGVKPCVNIPPHEHACTGALAQSQDAHRGIEKFVVADLEQFIARECLQNREKIFARVARTGKTGTRHQHRNLSPQQWNLVRISVVGR